MLHILLDNDMHLFVQIYFGIGNFSAWRHSASTTEVALHRIRFECVGTVEFILLLRHAAQLML